MAGIVSLSNTVHARYNNHVTYSCLLDFHTCINSWAHILQGLRYPVNQPLSLWHAIMALSPGPMDFSIRSSNKAKSHHDSYDALFDQYVDSGLFDSNDTFNGANSADSLQFFDLVASSGASDNVDSIATPDEDVRQDDACLSWQQTLELLRHNAALSDVQTSTGANKAAVLDCDHSSIENFLAAPAPSPLSGAAISQPSSPLAVASATKKLFTLPIRTNSQPKSPTRTSQRIDIPSPKMLSPAAHRTNYQGAWAKRIEASADQYNLQISPSHLPLSPPLSNLLTQNGFAEPLSPGVDAARLIVRPGEDDPDECKDFRPRMQTCINPQSPSFNNNNNNRIFSGQSTQGHPVTPSRTHVAPASLQTPPPSGKLPVDRWNPDPHEFLDYSYSASPNASTHKAEAWWSSPGTSAMQPCASAYQQGMQNAGQHMIGLGLEGFSLDDAVGSLVGGTTDRCDVEHQAFDDIVRSPGFDQTSFKSPQFFSPPTFFPGTPMTPNTAFSGRQRTMSRASTPSPTPSPRHSRVRQSKHIRSQSQHYRRKSMSAKEASQRPVSVGFVNFTPDDSRKILTGVAPSGSSKTKARREKEAADKRRKLSEAAKRAIMQAGGDVEALEREGFLGPTEH